MIECISILTPGSVYEVNTAYINIFLNYCIYSIRMCSGKFS